MLFFTLNAVKIVTFSKTGLLTREVLKELPALLPVLAVGLGLGKLINKSLNDAHSDWFVYIMLVIVIIMGWKLIRAPRPEPAPGAEPAQA